jgi:hypothetical protein
MSSWSWFAHWLNNRSGCPKSTFFILSAATGGGEAVDLTPFVADETRFALVFGQPFSPK